MVTDKPIIGSKAGKHLVQEVVEGARTDRIVLRKTKRGVIEKNLRENGLEEIGVGYICNLCLRSVTNGEVVKVHRKTSNPRNLRGENVSLGAHSYVCGECEREYLHH